MKILPNFYGSFFMSSDQLIFYAVEHYILIGLYTFLLFLVLMNFWNVIIQQKKYKSMPLLAFYIFALIAIFFRIIILIWFYSNSEAASIISVVQP